MNDTSREMVKIAVTALSEKQGRDITVIDIREVSPIADYYVITNGDNTNHVQALVDNLQEMMHKGGYVAPALEGYREARWVLLDYKDIVVNVFSRDDRRWFDLERIWRDGKFMDTEQMEELIGEKI